MTYELRSPTITFEAALRDIGTGSARARARAAHALGDVVDPALRSRAVAALIDALTDPTFQVRVTAAMSLGALDTEAAVEPLIQRLADAAPVVRQGAAIALGKLGFSSSFDALARSLAEGPPDLRFQAATSLPEIDPDRARKPLEQALEDDGDGEVVAAVALALGTLGASHTADTLWRRLGEWKRPAIRFDIAYALAELGDARAIDVLAEFVLHKDLAWDAIEALERCGHARAAEPLAPLLGRVLIKPRIKMRAAAALLALRRSGRDDQVEPPDIYDTHDAQARTVLLGGLRRRKLEERGLAVELLARVGGPWAEPALTAIREHRTGLPLREEIRAALAQIAARGRHGDRPAITLPS